MTNAKWSPNGKLIVTTSLDGTVRIWDPLTDTPQRRLVHQSSGVTSVAWSPDSKQIVIGSTDRSASIWDLTGKQIQLLRQHTGAVTGVAWGPDGKLIATAGEDRVVLLWDAASGNLLRTSSKAIDTSLDFSSPSDGALRVMFSPDSQRLAIATGGSAIFIWTIGTIRWSGYRLRVRLSRTSMSLLLSSVLMEVAYEAHIGIICHDCGTHQAMNRQLETIVLQNLFY